MESSSKFSTALIALVLSIGLSQTAHAAGESITVEQVSPILQLGTWRLTPPTGPQFSNHDTEVSKTITPAITGTYTLRVEPPLSASTTIRIFRDGILMKTVEGTVTTFTLPSDETIKAEIRYYFDGAVVVDSDPQGVNFELRGPGNVRYTGTTPETFYNVPPLYYQVHYSRMPGCTTVHSQERDLRTSSTLKFFAQFACDEISTATPSVNSLTRREVSNPENRQRRPKYMARIALSAHQAEVLPGSTMKVTLSARNIGTQNLNNFHIANTFDPSSVSILGPLSEDGWVAGSEAVWLIPQLFPGQLWSVTFDVKVSDHLKPGDKIDMVAHVEGQNLSPAVAGHTDIVEIAVAYLPETGGEAALFFLIGVAAAALISTYSIRRKTSVVLTV